MENSQGSSEISYLGVGTKKIEIFYDHASLSSGSVKYEGRISMVGSRTKRLSRNTNY